MMSVLWRPFMRQAASVAAEVVALAGKRPPQPGPHLCRSHGRIVDLSAKARDADLQDAVLAACVTLMPEAVRPRGTFDPGQQAPVPQG